MALMQTTIEENLPLGELDPGDYADRKEIATRISSLTREEVEAHNRLCWHQPDEQFDLSQLVEMDGRLFFHHRKTVEDFLHAVTDVEDTSGIEPYWRNLTIPLGAPIPPCTDARMTVKEGGNEGWMVHPQFVNRRERDGRYGETPTVREAWTAKFLADPREHIQAVNEKIFDLGSVSRAEEKWENFHAVGRHKSDAAKRLEEISQLKATEKVRQSETAWDWPQQVRVDVMDAARQVGWDLTSQILHLDRDVQIPMMSGGRIPGYR